MTYIWGDILCVNANEAEMQPWGMKDRQLWKAKGGPVRGCDGPEPSGKAEDEEELQ